MFEKVKERHKKQKALGKAFNEGKYFEYYEANPKYAPSYAVLRDDVLAETGDLKLAKRVVRKRKAKDHLIHFVKTVLYVEIFLSAVRGLEQVTVEKLLTSKYESYNEYVSREVDFVNENNLDTLDTIGYLFNYMTSYVEGYKNPEYDFITAMKYNLGENGYGVCRNFADDLTYKLDQIDDGYCPANLTVYEAFDQKDLVYYMAFNRPSDIRDENEREEHSSEESKEPSSFDNFIKEVNKYISPNHMVTLAKVPNENIVLVLDPTNAGVGVLLNGKIHMFNGNVEVLYEPIHTLFYDSPKMDYNFVKLVGLSYMCPYSYEELESRFGLTKEAEVQRKLYM